MMLKCFYQQNQMLGPTHKYQSTYKKNLKEIARMAHYEPIASIPQPSSDFNYTLIRNRYSDYYENPKVVRKSPIRNSQNLKLATILETHGRSPLFPKISQPRDESGEHLAGSPKRKVRGLRSHFKRQNTTTVTSRQRSLTIDTRLDSEEDNRTQNISELVEGIRPSNEKAKSLGYQTAERDNLQSNSSQLSSLISKRKYKESSVYSKSLIVPNSYEALNEEEESEGQEYEKDAVPGPGTYDYVYSDFDNKRTTQSTNASFLSKLTRFHYSVKQEKQPPKQMPSPIKEEIESNREKRIKSKLTKKAVPFNSMSPRAFQYDQLAKKKTPGPENYYPRQGIEQDLIRNIQRHFKSNFGANEPRFAYSTPANTHIGPGYYEAPPEESLVNQNFYFKSKKARFEG